SFVVESPSSFEAAVDPLRFEQVMTNLIGNAVKYSPSGGSITVDIAPLDDALVRIAVTDQGIGIPEQYRARVFEPFYQAHQGNPMSGLGLGLYISKQIVELHGGQLSLESPPERGTRFVVQLPVDGHARDSVAA